MKKILLITALAAFTLPASAVCSITGGACSVSLTEPQTIQGKYLPDRIEDLKEPDAFQPKYVTPYYDMLINTDEPSLQNAEAENYNSNCQFGVCLPGVEPVEGTIFDY